MKVKHRREIFYVLFFVNLQKNIKNFQFTIKKCL